jgi:hypothetical protein
VKFETPKGEKVPIETILLLNVSGFGISAVVKTRGRDSLFRNSRSRETRYNCVGGRDQAFREY